MSVLSSSLKRRRRVPNKAKFKTMGNHEEFLSRIKKTLYYGNFPLTERFSLPVSELAAEIFTEVKAGRSLERLCVEEAAEVSRSACVSPCSLILALFYLERLKSCNPDYVDRVSPSELFVVSMMVASKFLHDDGEDDEVFNDEWATSAGIDLKQINCYEKDFLKAINWEVFVNEKTFWTGLKGMEREVARREGRRRGWFSYTELETLLDCVDAWSLAHTFVMVSVVCLTSYTAGVMTLVGSAAVASRLPGHHLHTATHPPTSHQPPPATYPFEELSPLVSYSSPIVLPHSSSSAPDRLIEACLNNENLTCFTDPGSRRYDRTSDTDDNGMSLWIFSWFEPTADAGKNRSFWNGDDDTDHGEAYDEDEEYERWDDRNDDLEYLFSKFKRDGGAKRRQKSTIEPVDFYPHGRAARAASPFLRRSSNWLTDFFYDTFSPINVQSSATIFPLDLSVTQ